MTTGRINQIAIVFLHWAAARDFYISANHTNSKRFSQGKRVRGHRIATEWTAIFIRDVFHFHEVRMKRWPRDSMCHEIMKTHARDSVKKHLLPMPLCNFTRRKHSYEANPIMWNSHCESCSCDGAVSQKQRPRGFQGVRLRCIVLVATADYSAVAPRVVCKSKCQREGCVKAYQYNTFRPPWALPFTRKRAR